MSVSVVVLVVFAPVIVLHRRPLSSSVTVLPRCLASSSSFVPSHDVCICCHLRPCYCAPSPFVVLLRRPTSSSSYIIVVVCHHCRLSLSPNTVVYHCRLSLSPVTIACHYRLLSSSAISICHHCSLYRCSFHTSTSFLYPSGKSKTAPAVTV